MIDTAKIVNAQNENSQTTFIESVENTVRKNDAKVLLPLFEDVTGKPSKMWDKNMVGYGSFKYQRKNGQEFEWFNTGFSPGKAYLNLFRNGKGTVLMIAGYSADDTQKAAKILAKYEDYEANMAGERLRISSAWIDEVKISDLE